MHTYKYSTVYITVTSNLIDHLCISIPSCSFLLVEEGLGLEVLSLDCPCSNLTSLNQLQWFLLFLIPMSFIIILLLSHTHCLSIMTLVALAGSTILEIFSLYLGYSVNLLGICVIFLCNIFLVLHTIQRFFLLLVFFNTF